MREALELRSVRWVIGLVALHVGAALVCVALAVVLWSWFAVGALVVAGCFALWVGAFRAWFTAPPRPMGAWLRRANHPRLFALVDDVAAQMGMPSLDELELIADANAFAAQRDGRDVVALGMPLLAVNLRWEIKATIAHELGHVRCGDASHPGRAAYAALAVLADDFFQPRFNPFAALARRAARELWDERVELGRKHEHRADAWSAFVVGRGAVGPSLRVDAHVSFVWRRLLMDLEVLARHGLFVDNAFALLRRAYEVSQRTGRLTTVDAMLDIEEAASARAEHPALADRSRHADHMVRMVAHHAPATDDIARTLLDEVDALERSWTRALPPLLFGRPIEQLRVVDDDSARARAYQLHAAEARAAIEARAGIVDSGLPLSALFQIVHTGLTGHDADRTWFVPLRIGRAETHVQVVHFRCTPDEAEPWLRGLLTEAILAGSLPGELALGVTAQVELGGAKVGVSLVAERLAAHRGTWTEVLVALERGERAVRDGTAASTASTASTAGARAPARKRVARPRDGRPWTRRARAGAE